MQPANLPFEPASGQHVQPLPHVSSAELVREAMLEAKELVKLEVALAKEEVKREVLATKSAAIALGLGAALLVVGLSLLLFSLASAIFPGPIPSLVLGLILAGGAALAGIAGMKLLPKKPLAETLRRLETDIETVKERVT
jgi:hypothetical protein